MSGGPGPLARKQPGLSSTYWGSNAFIQMTTIVFSKDPKGSDTFQGYPTVFQGGGQMLITIEIHVACDFPRGCPGPLIPPLDLYMLIILTYFWHGDE